MDEIKAWFTELDAQATWAAFETARSGLFAWLAGRNDNMDDKDVVECNEFIMGALSDTDQARKIELLTGKDIRKMTVEEAQDLYEEMRLRGMADRN